MESYGAELAARHRLGSRHKKKKYLLSRLNNNEKVLQNCSQRLINLPDSPKAARHLKEHPALAGEGLPGNYRLVEMQIYTARQLLSRSYLNDLPCLSGGKSEGLPRIYDLALENVTLGDGKVNSGTLKDFVKSYQTVTQLWTGELWALPMMLRLALIENLRLVVERIELAQRDRREAAKWGDRLLKSVGQGRESVLAVARIAGSGQKLSCAFVAELARRMQGQGALSIDSLKWIEDELGKSGESIDLLIRKDSLNKAKDQLSISNTLTSLDDLRAIDWRGFVESLSIIEHLLRQDPLAVYPKMDFTTRDKYRQVVEHLARKYSRPESLVAQTALELAQKKLSPDFGSSDDILSETSSSGAGAKIFAHVGFYLVDKGLPILKQAIAGEQNNKADKKAEALWKKCLCGRDRTSLPRSLYLGLVLFLSLSICGPFFLILYHGGLGLSLALLGSLPVLPVASQLAVKFADWLASLCIEPQFMPRLDYRHGIPASARTLVVIPAMIGSAGEVRNLLEKLEVHYLANRDANLQFGLLTDFKDSNSRTRENEQALLELAKKGLEALNLKYPSLGLASGSGSGPGCGLDNFFLCHRPRAGNEAGNLWMDQERKQGKLCNFNDLLQGSGQEDYLLLAGNTVAGAQAEVRVRYVITLNAKTRLPHGAAHLLIGTMDHPLNRPVYDGEKRAVVSGYGIIQARPGINLPGARRSGYARLFCSAAGVDPCLDGTPDLCQGLPRPDSSIGQGIYNVDIFEKVIARRFPDNHLLSHDLAEGGCARSGQLDEVLFYEDFPSGYSADAARRQHWLRGDWQLLPWIFPRVPAAAGGLEANSLSLFSRWKIFARLRRSLVPPALLTVFGLGWFVTPNPLLWTALLLMILFGLSLFKALPATPRRSPKAPLSKHRLGSLGLFAREILGTFTLLLWLPFEALYTLEAIFGTLWRMFAGKRRLPLAASEEREWSSIKTLPQYIRLMKSAPICALLVALSLALAKAPVLTWVAAAPFLFFWIFAPVSAWLLSRARPSLKPKGEQKRSLRLLARRTWAFFDKYLGPEDNWLPPDNLQESPVAALTHRTSPTNMGIALLSCLAAHDFGYLSGGALVERLQKTLDTMAGLKRFRNHFYNCYDTQTLIPQQPEYISTLDSGNLAGYLMTLHSALRELPDEPILQPRLFEGLIDTAAIIANNCQPLSEGLWDCNVLLEALGKLKSRRFGSLHEAAENMRALIDIVEETCASYSPAINRNSEIASWIEALLNQCKDIFSELSSFALLPDDLPEESPLLCPSLRQLAQMNPKDLPEAGKYWALEIRKAAAGRIAEIKRLTRLTARLSNMDFGFLYDRRRGFFSIGYNSSEGQLDDSHYELLASEARLAYFVAIAKGQVPQKSWFALGRFLDAGKTGPALLSWSGSMSEYLTPLLIMPSYAGSLLGETCKEAVRRQIGYVQELGRPWGISTSACNLRDQALNYQCRAFGIPALSLKGDPGKELVLAPYASVLAAMFEPEVAWRNLEKLAAKGLVGRFGMYEAVDYTRAHLAPGQKFAVVSSYRARHQGLSLLALARLLLGQPMQTRFLACPDFKASELLLEERLPAQMPEYPRAGAGFTADSNEHRGPSQGDEWRVFPDPNEPRPAVQLFSNNHYHLMISSAGGGSSRYQDLDLTRWREDPTRDNYGTFCYLRDLESGEFWSNTFQPAGKRADYCEAAFSEARAEFKLRKNDLEVQTEISVSPEENIELRRLHLNNSSRGRRIIELTSYAEVVLAPARADAQEPVFSNLFVQMEIDPDLQAIICTRRSDQEKPLFMFQTLVAHKAPLEAVSYETDRSRFIGRGRDLSAPAAMDIPAGEGTGLSGRTGAVLDPVLAIRGQITLEAGQKVVIDLIGGVGASKKECRRLIAKFKHRHLADQVFDLAWTYNRVLLRHFNISLHEARLYEQMASSLLYFNSDLRADVKVLSANKRGQSVLWGQAIFGDLPIALLKLGDLGNADDFVRQMLKAHAYWRLKGLKVDLIIWNEEQVGYSQNLCELVLDLLFANNEINLMNQPGGIFIRSAEQFSLEDRILIQSAARLIISDRNGSLAEQVCRRQSRDNLPGLCPLIGRTPGVDWEISLRPGPQESGLVLTNSYGGSTPDGREYVIILPPGVSLPAARSNVLSNPDFGSVISESGSAYTWKENAHEFRLTPWMNDPVQECSGEALYLRDEETGYYWSPTPWPRRGSGSYEIRHGFGYSVFKHSEDGLASELWTHVDRKAPVKLFCLKIKNNSGRSRRLSATGYVEWALGDLRSRGSMYIGTRTDPQTGAGAIFARNPYVDDFAGQVAFFNVSHGECSFTGDRREFIGCNASLSEPAAMRRICLSDRIGFGLDPCAAVQRPFELPKDESREIVFVLGAGNNYEQASTLAKHFSKPENCAASLQATIEYWRRLLDRIKIRTPDQNVDVLVNGWLMHQVVATRLQAHSGYYQSGGAIGFREQPQDSMAMLYRAPEKVREDLLLCAARQFPEGDVRYR